MRNKIVLIIFLILNLTINCFSQNVSLIYDSNIPAINFAASNVKNALVENKYITEELDVSNFSISSSKIIIILTTYDNDIVKKLEARSNISSVNSNLEQGLWLLC